MPMTDEERRAARNAASKRWYAAHKAAKKAAAKAGAKQKPAKKVEAKPAKPAKPTKKTRAKAAKPVSKGRDPLREAEKLVKKFAKVAAGIKPMLCDAVEILDRAYRGGDEKYVGKVERVLRKGLGIGIVDDGAKTKAGIEAWSKGIRMPAFRLPVKELAEEPAVEPVPEEPVPEEPAPEEPVQEEPATEKPTEVPVDPAMLTGVEEGTVTKDDIEAQASAVGDEDDEDDEGDDEEEKDPEDMDDEEYERYRERQAEKETDAFFEGRAEAMRELEEQGAFDD